jgi:hypothetical protein
MRLARRVHSHFAYGKRFKATRPNAEIDAPARPTTPDTKAWSADPPPMPPRNPGVRQALVQPAAEVRHPRLPMAAEMAQTLTRSGLTLRRGCHSGVKKRGRDDGACLVTTTGR